MEKNKILKLLFSLVPGAGYMYLNMMVKGTVFMMGFAALSVISMGFYFNALLLFLPVIWCYTFFDTFHMGILSYEERVALDNAFFEKVKQWDVRILTDSVQNKRRLIGGVCVVLGSYLLVRRVFYRLMWHVADAYQNRILYEIIDFLPNIVVAILLIILGVQLMKREKNADFQPYVGETPEAPALSETNPENAQTKE